MNRKVRFWLGVVVSIASLVLAVKTVSIEETWSALRQTDYYPLLPALAALGLTLAGKAARWKLLFDPRAGHVPLSKAFSVLIIGQMINLLFPLRMGEIARAYFMGEMAGSNKPLAMATVMVEKAVDMLAVLLLVIVLLLAMPFPEWLQRPALSLAAISILLLAALLFLAHQRGRLSELIARLAGIVPRSLRPGFLREQSDRFLDGLAALRDPRAMTSVGALTCLVWFTSAVTNYFVFLALGLDLPFVASVFLLLVLQVGVAVPSGPGKIGVFQYLAILALSIFLVSPEQALAAGVVLYLVVHAPPIVLGLFFLWQYHLGLWRIRALAQEGEVPSP